MTEIIALLEFAVANDLNFTEHDPSGMKQTWIKWARKALADLKGARSAVVRVREVEVICPNCNLAITVPVPESHGE